jgi:voltage-gated potassium channel Kch
MLKSILVGVVLIGVTVAVHAVGSTYWLRFVAGRFSSSEQEWRPRRALAALIGTAIALLQLHVVEVVLWALTYLALPRITRLETLEEAVYFSVVTFTTLGYGDVTLDKAWRLLSGIEAMNGILLFGLTTATLFSVVQKVDLALKKSRDST